MLVCISLPACLHFSALRTHTKPKAWIHEKVVFFWGGLAYIYIHIYIYTFFLGGPPRANVDDNGWYLSPESRGVSSAATGDPLLTFDDDSERPQTVRAVKAQLTQRLGFNRFRLKLLCGPRVPGMLMEVGKRVVIHVYLTHWQALVYVLYIHCRTPVWLKTAFAVLVQEGGGVLVHGWCAEKENKGKGGSGQGKIGAGVGSCRSGSRWDPVGHQFLHFWAPLLASRDPVGIQSGTNVGRQPNS